MDVVVTSSIWLPFIIVAVVLYASWEKEDDYTPWTMVQEVCLLMTFTLATQPVTITVLILIIMVATMVAISYHLRHTEQVED